MPKKIKFIAPLILIAQFVFLCSCGTASLSDKVWAFSQSHPDGFTIDVRTMTEPSEGIAVSYAATQDSHSRHQLGKVVNHALQQDGYVGGWFNRAADGSLRKLHEKYGFVYAFATDTLSNLRSQIDEIDSQLVDLVAKRMRISREIGQYKKIHGMGIVQSNRFNEILEKRCAQGTSQGIDPACVKSIFEAIHQESVNQQKEIQTAK